MNIRNFLRNTFGRIKQIWKKIKPRSWRHAVFVLATTFLVLLILVVLIVLYYAFQVPDPSLIFGRKINESTKIYDRTGEYVLYDVHGEEKRTIIAWEQISPHIKNATLAAEDTNFYKHPGIDIKGILRAIWRDITSLSAGEGGSTITQQLVKKAIVGENKTLARKIKEALLAIQIERAYSKDQIFWMYLNQIPYGSNAYGIEAASQTFFGKPASETNIAEAATLASLPNRPSYLSPYGKNQERLRARSLYVMARMRDLAMITETEYQEAIATPIVFQEESNHFPAPHFVIMVRDYLINKYGEDLVQNGGLKVITTLDKKKYDLADGLVKKYAPINEKNYKADNMAFVAMDPKTGQILAMIGSRDYWDTEHNGNYNVALTNIRQPGSSFKPFAYAALFEKGFPDSTVIFDLPTEFNPSCDASATQTRGNGACYNPRNYLGNFSGPVTLRQALARSLNVPAVKTLYLAGIKNTVELTTSMGVTSLDPKASYGLSLVLGGAGVSLHDMVSGYSVFANDGVRAPSTFILKITTSDGAVLEEYQPHSERVLSAQSARMISDILSDNEARSAVFGFNSSLNIPGRKVAAKTGTTQNNRDGWIIGYTPSLVAGVWTGNNNDKPMTAAGAGSSAAGPMWKEFMTTTLKDYPVDYFIKPGPVVSDKPMLNGEYRDGNGEIHTILHYTSSPSDPQYKNWELSLRKWVTETGQDAIPTPSVTPFPEESPQRTVFPVPSPTL